jgi:two-component sensor histidine kinase
MLHYGIEDGLPSNMIYDIYQDPDGFIWIGTDKGVARYNGQKFETFTTADGLSDNECFFFQPDHYGRMWIGTYNGELCYYKDGIFHNAKNTPWLKLSKKASHTTEITSQADSSIIIHFKDDAGFYEIRQNNIRHLNTEKFENDYYWASVRHIKKEKKNRYSIYYRSEQIIIDSNSNILQRIPYKNLKFRAFIAVRSDIFYLTDSNRIFSETFEDQKLQSLFKQNLIINKIIKKGSIFNISTSKGAIISNEEGILSNLQIHSILKDSRNDYWIGTANNGLYKLSNFFKNQYKINYLADQPVIFSAKLGKNLIYTTKNRSSYLIDFLDKKVKCFFHNNELPQNTTLGKSLQWVEGENLFNISHNHNYRISKINSNKPIVQRLSIDSVSGAHKTILAGGTRYIKTQDVVYFYKDSDFVNEKDTLKRNLILFPKYQRVTLYGFTKDRNESVWFSSINKIFKLINRVPILQTQFKNIAFREFTFITDKLIGITHQNELLIGNGYNTKKVTFDTIQDNYCVWEKFYSINDSMLLISTNNYFRILTIHSNPNENKYDIRLLENPFIPYQPEHLLVDSDQCYFFKNGILSIFPTNYILRTESRPNLKFLFLKTDQNKSFIKDTMLLDYYLSHNIKIDFTPISFYHTNLQYEYSINSGKIDNWNSLNGEELNLIKIGFGNFIIKVRAKTMSGQYSKPIAFTLIIKKPFWATYWFIGFISLFVITIIAFVARWSIKRNLRKKENEVRFLRSEYKALNALMNPHFIFNSLNSVQSLVNNNDISTASKYIRIFSDLIRQNMRNISQDLIPLSKELNLVENYLRIEQLRFKDRLSFEINIDENVETELILIPPLLIQPLVENAIKHGIWPLKSNDGNLKISIYETEEILVIEIVDNGVGLKKKQSDTMHESYAMGNIYKRIEQLSQIHQIDIKVDIQEIRDITTGKAQGVKAVVSIRSKQ